MEPPRRATVSASGREEVARQQTLMSVVVVVARDPAPRVVAVVALEGGRRVSFPSWSEALRVVTTRNSARSRSRVALYDCRRARRRSFRIVAVVNHPDVTRRHDSRRDPGSDPFVSWCLPCSRARRRSASARGSRGGSSSSPSSTPRSRPGGVAGVGVVWGERCGSSSSGGARAAASVVVVFGPLRDTVGGGRVVSSRHRRARSSRAPVASVGASALSETPAREAPRARRFASLRDRPTRRPTAPPRSVSPRLRCRRQRPRARGDGRRWGSMRRASAGFARLVPLRVASCRFVSLRVASCRFVSLRDASCRFVLRRVASCRVGSLRATSLRVSSRRRRRLRPRIHHRGRVIGVSCVLPLRGTCPAA